MSTKILVDYSGVIRSHSGKKQEWITIEENATVKDLLTQLGYKEDHHKFILATINGERATLGTKLINKVAIKLFLPAGGG